MTLRLVQALDVPAHIELAFEEGTPIAVNGITMSVQELNEILTTIAGKRVLPGGPADAVLAQAREALAATAERPATGVVHMKLHHGEQIIVSVSPSSLAPHS